MEQMRFSTQETAERNEPLSFQEQLATAWNKLHPESEVQKYEDRAERQSELEETERKIDESDAFNLIEEYGYDAGEIREAEHNNVFELAVKSHFDDRRLPQGYAYKGGAARALLLRSLGIDRAAQPRDLDLIRIGEESREGADDEVAQEFMPDDFEHGYGVEAIENLDEYFQSRDLTINEIYATDEHIFATKQCLFDTVRHIIRITDFELDRYDEPADKMLAKMLRFYSENIVKYGEGALEGIPGWKFEEYFVGPFWLALQMDRALERDPAVAQQLVHTLANKGQIPAKIFTVEEAIEYINGLMYDPFYFRHAPEAQFEMEEEWLEMENGFKNEFEQSRRS